MNRWQWHVNQTSPMHRAKHASGRHWRCIAKTSPMSTCDKISRMHLENFQCKHELLTMHSRCLFTSPMLSRRFQDVNLNIGNASRMHRRCQWDQGFRGQGQSVGKKKYCVRIGSSTFNTFRDNLWLENRNELWLRGQIRPMKFLQHPSI